MSDWKVGAVTRAERAAMASYFKGHAQNCSNMSSDLRKGAEWALAGSAFALVGAVGLACIGASGGLAAPAVAVGMQALLGATMAALTGSGMLKKMEHSENKRSEALHSAVGRLQKGAMMDVVLLELERGNGTPALGKSFVERLGFRRAAKAERDEMLRSRVEAPRPMGRLA